MKLGDASEVQLDVFMPNLVFSSLKCLFPDVFGHLLMYHQYLLVHYSDVSHLSHWRCCASLASILVPSHLVLVGGQYLF